MLDETGMPLDPKSQKTIVQKGTKHPRTVISGDKAQITVLACCSAARNVLPPVVVFDRKCLKPEICENKCIGYCMVCLILAANYLISGFCIIFYQYAPSARHLTLLLYGHSSHYNPRVIRKATEEKVIIFCFPPTLLMRPSP